MRLRIQAIRSLRWNHTCRGVWVWLKGRQQCRRCQGEGRVPLGARDGIVGLTSSAASFTARACPSCEGEGKVRGYQRILSEPERVISEQTAAAEGVFG